MSSLFGGKTKTSTTQSSTQRMTVDPVYQQAMEDQYARAQDVAAGWKPVAMPNMPELTPDQIALRDQIRAMQGQSTLGGLKDQYGQFLNFQAPQVSARNVSAPGGFQAPNVSAGTATASLADRGDIRDISNQNVNAAQFSREGLERILAGMDPSYTNAVRDTTLQDINRSRTLAQVPNADAAAVNGAFGGSRHGILEAETNRAYGDIAARTSADLNLNYYNSALGQLQADLGRQQQAGMFNSDAALRAAAANQGVDANVALQNAQLGTQTSIANAGNQTQANVASGQFATQAGLAAADNALRAQIANQHAGLTAGLANQDAGFRAANLGLTATDRLFGVNNEARQRHLQDLTMLQSIGNQDYDISAANNDIAYRNALAVRDAPAQSLDILQRSAAMLPTNPTTTSTGNSEQITKQTPGLFDVLGFGMQFAAPFIPGLGGGGRAAAPRTPSILESFGGNLPQAPNIGYQIPQSPLMQMQGPSVNYRGYY